MLLLLIQKISGVSNAEISGMARMHLLEEITPRITGLKEIIDITWPNILNIINEKMKSYK